MSFIYGYVRRVVMVVLLVRVALMLAPDGELKSYVRFVCGLLLLTAIMSPLVGLVPAIEREVGELPGVVRVTAPSGEGKQLAETAWASTEHLTASLYSEHLADMMATEINGLPILRAGGYWCRVKAEVSPAGEVERVQVMLLDEKVDDREATRSPIRVARISIGGEASNEGNESDVEVSPEVRDAIVGHVVTRYALREEQVAVVWGEGDRR